MAMGVVKFYKTEKGWGAISSDCLPPGRDAWVHVSMIEGGNFLYLDAGDVVEFDYEEGRQDSFDYRATRVRKL